MANIPLGGSIGVPGSVSILGNYNVIFASDANHTLTATEWSNNFLEVTSGVSLTATRNLVGPLNQGQGFTIQNNTTGSQAIQIIGATGTGITIPNGDLASVVCDGYNYLQPSASITFAGDLTGSNTSQTVVNITGTGGNIPFNATIIGEQSTSHPVSFGVGAIVMPSDANLTLSAAQLVNPLLRITSTPTLTATRNIVLPATTGAIYYVYNSTTGGQALQFIAATGSGITVANGLKTTVYFDGTNYVVANVAIGGDLSAASNIAQTVIALRGKTLDTSLATIGASQDGYALTWVNASTDWQAKSIPAGFTAGGDLSGTSTAQTIIQISGTSTNEYDGYGSRIPFLATEVVFASGSDYPIRSTSAPATTIDGVTWIQVASWAPTNSTGEVWTVRFAGVDFSGASNVTTGDMFTGSVQFLVNTSTGGTITLISQAGSNISTSAITLTPYAVTSVEGGVGSNATTFQFRAIVSAGRVILQTIGRASKTYKVTGAIEHIQRIYGTL